MNANGLECNNLYEQSLRVLYIAKLQNSVCLLLGFLGVYLAGHILELTQSWPAVFSTAALINSIGWIIFTIFGSAQAIV